MVKKAPKIELDNEDETTAGNTPAVAMTSHANRHESVDVNGHHIGLRDPGVLANLRVLKIVGDYPARYIATVLPLFYIDSIDGEECTPINSEAEINVLAKRIGTAGMNAVTDRVAEVWGEAAAGETDRNAVKK